MWVPEYHERVGISQTPPLGPDAHLPKECHVGMGGTITRESQHMMLPSTDGRFLVGPLLPPVARLGVSWVSEMFSES